MSTPTGFDGIVLPVRDSTETRAVTENDVVSNGEIIGTDPDENARLQILKGADIRNAAGGSGGE
jgi:hypothetical protein